MKTNNCALSNLLTSYFFLLHKSSGNVEVTFVYHSGETLLLLELKLTKYIIIIIIKKVF